MTSSADERCLLSWRLAEREATYWYDVDHNWGRRAREFYIEDGIFDLGAGEGARYRGILEIEKFYRWRESRGIRTARHLISNFIANFDEGDFASATYVMSLFAEDGPPVRPAKPAIMIADVSLRMALCPDGQWRAAERKLTAVFMGGEKPTIMKTGQTT